MFEKPSIIVFLGIDGSGKTTQAIAFNETLIKEGYNSVYVWSRRVPYLSKLPAKIFKRYILREKEETEGESYLAIKNKRTLFFRNRLFRAIWIKLSLFEYLLLIYLKVVLPNRNRAVVVCDRYLFDAIIDFALSCSMSLTEISDLLNSWIASLFPQPLRVYFIDIEPKVGSERKTDGTSIAYLQDRVPVYRHISKIIGAQSIDGNLSIELIKGIIWTDAQKMWGSHCGQGKH